VEEVREAVPGEAAGAFDFLPRLAPETLEDKFQALESEDKVEQLLKEIKSKMAANG